MRKLSTIFNKSAVYSKCEEIFGIDVRSLAVFRMCLSLILLIDISLRMMDILPFYSDYGVLPRSLLMERVISPYNLSINMISGAPEFQYFLFLVAFIAALALLVGYRTRIATITSWFLLMSVQIRNPVVADRGDFLILVLLFWGMFVPLGAAYSLDESLNPSEKRSQRIILSTATFALLMQVLFVYWFSSLSKTSQDWGSEGSALYYTLNVDMHATPLAVFLRQTPFSVLRFLTHGILLFEKFAPFVLIFSAFLPPLRIATVSLFILFHLGIAACLDIGTFAWTDITALLLFLPTWFWRMSDDRCVFFKEAVYSLQNIFDKGAAMIRNGENGITNFLKHFSARPLRAAGSNFSRDLSNFIAGLLFIFVLISNISFVRPKIVLPDSLRLLGDVLNIHQRWNMFTPVLREDGWFIVPGVLRNGKKIDLLTHSSPVKWEKPLLVSATFPNGNWRKYLMGVLFDTPERREAFLLALCRYYCFSWNSAHRYDVENQLDTFQIYFMSEWTLLDNKTGPVTPKLLSTFYCFGLPQNNVESGQKSSL